MIRRVYRSLAVVTLAWAGCGGSVHPRHLPILATTVRLSETRPLMGVPWTVTLHARDRSAGEQALEAAFAEAARLERVLSDYDPESELSRLSASAPSSEPVRVGNDLWNVLVRGGEVRRLTDGAFDITVGPLTTLWRQARRSGRFPRPEKLAAARAAVGGDGVVLDPATRSVRLTRSAMRLDPGGIGMGYAADRVLQVLADRGVESAMVDASGDVVVSGPPPGAEGWRIAVRGIPGDEDPEVLVLEHAAVTTSGDATQFVEIDGRRYSHIVDPRTGVGVSGPAAVTVVAPDGVTADALATAASVLGPAAGPAVVERFPGAAARFVWRDGEAVNTSTTAGWPGP
ncbi:MAG: FAD:protein FMN transferase [Planctomycetota bacterium]